MNLCPENGEQGASCEFNQHLGIFREIPLFAGMPLKVHKVLAYLCARETFEPGEHLFQQGDDDGQGIYVLSGELILSRRDDEGNRTQVADYGAGDFLGGLALLAPASRLFSLEARTEAVCMVLHRDKFLHAMEQFPELMPKAIQAMVKRIGDWDKHALHHPDAFHAGVSVV